MKLNITKDVLDRLGFSEYWDEHGTWGGRTLTFSNGTKFRIIEQLQHDDDPDIYVGDHYYFTGWFATPKSDEGHYDLFFLHEMYNCIKEVYPDCLNEFLQLCHDAKMSVYLE